MHAENKWKFEARSFDRLPIETVTEYSVVEAIDCMRKLVTIFHCWRTVDWNSLTTFHPTQDRSNFVVFMIIWCQKSIFGIHPNEDSGARCNNCFEISSFILFFLVKAYGIPARSGVTVPVDFIFCNSSFSNNPMEVKKLSKYRCFPWKLLSEIRSKTTRSIKNVSFSLSTYFPKYIL